MVAVSLKKVFFKQKTAYEIGTGDWSSDVCSSDLAAGEELLATDGNVDANERQDFNIYINMLENYINQNDKFKQNGAIYTGLTKNQGGLGVDAPIKSGVPAPRKR